MLAEKYFVAPSVFVRLLASSNFPLQPAWTNGIFWLLSLADLAIAVYAFVASRAGAATRICDCGFCFLIGAT
jgi:hypothetical protein